jgi:hypothetical protein
MFGCDSNFTMAKNFALAIVSKYDAITCCIILLKGCEHLLLPGHMICVSSIKNPTCSTGGVDLQERIKPCF